LYFVVVSFNFLRGKALALTKKDLNITFEMWTQGRLVPSLGTNTGAPKIPFQTWRNFKEAFAPELVARAINDCGLAVGRCIDPFGGSGTTSLACQFLGVEPVTIEVNPYLADLIQAKLEIYDADALVRELGTIIRRAKYLKPDPDIFKDLPGTFIEPGVKGRWIFDKEVAIRIMAYRKAIEDLSNSCHRTLYRALLGGLVIEVSNVIVSGKGRRYRRGWQTRKQTSADVDWQFSTLAQQAIFDIHAHKYRGCSNYLLLRGDSREILRDSPKCDLAVFSPPYPNSFDYTDVYNVELWMLGYLTNFQSNLELRKSTLCSHVQVLRDYPKPPTGSTTLIEALEKLDQKRDALWNHRIPNMIGGYFHDMAGIFLSLNAILSSRGEAWVVVGDSRYANVHIPTAKILSELAPGFGYEVASHEPMRSMRSSAQQGGLEELAETLLVFRKSN
jgi:hypothetical protein